MPAISHDLRVAVRALARRPGFSLTALVTIAVAIAGNTAIFSVVRGVLLSSLPFRDPHELVTLDVRSHNGFLVSNSVPNYRDWGSQARVFRSYGGSMGWTMTRTAKGAAEVMELRAALGDFFGTLGMSAAMGRVMGPEETERGGEATVVLGWGYWKSALAGDPAALGKSLVLDGQGYTIIGILPQGIGFPNPDVAAYVPMGTLPGLPWDDRRSGFGMRMIARLKPGVSVTDARSDLERVGREVRAANTADTPSPELRSLDDFFVSDVRLQVWLLMGAVGFVLLIAAGNVANLLLARGEARRQEMAVRTALGAGRATLVRQVLMESMVLSVAGGIVGVLLARGCIALLLVMFGGSLPAFSVAHVRLDTGIMGFALLLSVGTGLLFGLIPALRASRITLAEEIRSGSKGVAGTRDRLRSLLVVSELALALVLLVGAVLMIRSLQQLQSVDKGFDASNVLTARTRLPRAISTDTARWRGFYADVVERLRGLPGVKSAAVSLLLPLSDRSWERGIWPEGVPPIAGTGQSVLYNIVSPDYFGTLGVAVVKGRAFTDSDRSGSTLVAIIDESMAARFWPGADPINKRVTLETTTGGHDGEAVYRTVVGVVKNVRHYELANPSRIQVYIPFAQINMGFGPTLSFVVKSATTATAQIQPVRQTVTGLNPDIPVTDLQAMQDYVDTGLAGNRALVELLGAFGAVALLLASIGIFGVMSYTVAQRTREIGVRIALGATRAQVLGWVTGRALLLCGIGVLVGESIAAGLSRVLTRLLFQVSPLDLRIYAGVALLLLIAALTAAFLPARRAAAVDPIEALRGE